MKSRAILAFAVLVCSTLAAQRQAPPPQGPRQALIEMITGGEKSVARHLTREVQELLASAGSGGTSVTGMLNPVLHQRGSEMQTFDSGPVLLSFKQAPNARIEVRVENDDLNGDEDALELSAHTVHDGGVQELEDWETFLSRVTVNLKKEAGIWRLNRIGIGLEFPIGSAEFLKKTLLKGTQQLNRSQGVAVGVDIAHASEEPREIDYSLREVLPMVVISEFAFAREHPEAGFTCSLSDLGDLLGQMRLGRVVSEGTYKGYKLSLLGCQGRPAGSFQLVAEPLAGTPGRAFCTDATQNVRVSDDGRGSTCLALGRAEQSGDETGRQFYGTHSVVPAPAPLDKDPDRDKDQP